jgi:hypothetical protein
MKTPFPSLALTFLIVAMLLNTVQQSARAEDIVGGYSKASATNAEVIAAAQFAVREKAAKEPKTAVSLVEILGAEQQVVAGMNYRLKLKVKVNGAEKIAEAVVWWQAWRKPDPYQLTSWEWK